MSNPYDIRDGDSIVSKEPAKGMQSNALYRIFDIYTWVSLFSCIPVCGAALYFCHRLAHIPHNDITLWDSCWELIVIICWEGITIKQPTWSVMFIFATYMFMVFIIISEYFGMYTAVVAIGKYSIPPLDTLEQLWESDRKWMSDYPSNTRFYLDYFKDVENIDARLHNFSTVNTNYTPEALALKQVLETRGQVVYFQVESIALHEIKTHGLEKGTDIKYYFSKERFNKDFTVLYYHKRCYFAEYLNRAILLANAMFIDVLENERYSLKDDIKNTLKQPLSTREDGLIKLKHLTAAGVIIGGMCGLSFICLIMEIICAFPKRRLRKVS